MGFFSRPFDLNRDGKMSPKERALQYTVLKELMDGDDDLNFDEDDEFYSDEDDKNNDNY